MHCHPACEAFHPSSCCDQSATRSHPRTIAVHTLIKGHDIFCVRKRSISTRTTGLLCRAWHTALDIATPLSSLPLKSFLARTPYLPMERRNVHYVATQTTIDGSRLTQNRCILAGKWLLSSLG